MSVKFYITFKTPDAIDDAINDELENVTERYLATAKAEGESDLDDDEQEDLFNFKDEVTLQMREVATKFISHGEYVTVEFDTEAKTATVQEAGSKWH